MFALGLPQWIAAHDLAGSLDAGNIAVVDARGPDEFAASLGHIREARNLPVGELPQACTSWGC